MKILNFHKDEAKLLVESMDDLWYLSSIIDVGDTIQGKTFRKIKMGGEDDRNMKVVRKPVHLSIAVEKVEFHKYSDILRVSGKVLEGKDDIPKGSYHTFNLEANTTFTLTKTEWFKYQRQKLEESAKEHKPDTLICLFDREEAYFAIMKNYGFDVLTELKGDVAKKADIKQAPKNFYEDIIKTLKEYTDRLGIKHIILASPSFWKEELMKNLKDEKIKSLIVPATCSSCDKGAINEVLKRPEVQSVLARDRTSKEMKLVEELLSEISKEGASAYGTDETGTAAQAGAVRDLLVTDGLIQKTRQDETFNTINDIMKAADRSGAGINIISSDHDGGKKLDGLGGIAAILRYKMNF
ncbi:mRNA surveillance protein pelota [Candidatus Woesearchaeota archaeon]|nr:mRNA surveillance protein pelota [Candidatus Woesearchaeota archaeon]